MTQQSRHTPGPWAVNPTGDMWDGLVGTMDEPIAICEGDDAIANARLIAAAPDLLAACIRLILAADHSRPTALISNISEAIDKARAAIAKAKGASSVLDVSKVR